MTKVIKINGTIVSDQHKEIYDEWKIENASPSVVFNNFLQTVRIQLKSIFQAVGVMRMPASLFSLG